MLEVEKINNDFAALFEQGRALLCEGHGETVNGKREEAFSHFKALGGVPYKTEDYLYTNLLPVFSRDYKAVFKYIPQEVDLKEVFRCAVPNLETNLLLTVNGWYFDGNAKAEVPDGVVVCSFKEAAQQYPDLFAKHYAQYSSMAAKDGLVALNTAFAQDGVFVYVPDGVVVEKPLQIVNLLRAKADLLAFQRNLVVLGNGAQATLLVCDHTLSQDNFLMNNATEVYLGENARLDY